MRRSLRSTSLASLAILAACAGTGAAPPALDLSAGAVAIAVDYLDALRVADWERAAALASEDLWYFDPTMEAFDRPAIDLHSRAEALDFYRSATEDSDTSSVTWEVVDGFEAGPWVVLELRLDVITDGAFWDVDADEVTIAGARQVSAVRVEDGLVTDHIDLVAYGDAMVQIDAQRARFGPAR